MELGDVISDNKERRMSAYQANLNKFITRDGAHAQACINRMRDILFKKYMPKLKQVGNENFRESKMRNKIIAYLTGMFHNDGFMPVKLEIECLDAAKKVTI